MSAHYRTFFNKEWKDLKRNSCTYKVKSSQKEYEIYVVFPKQFLEHLSCVMYFWPPAASAASCGALSPGQRASAGPSPPPCAAPCAAAPALVSAQASPPAAAPWTESHAEHIQTIRVVLQCLQYLALCTVYDWAAAPGAGSGNWEPQWSYRSVFWAECSHHGCSLPGTDRAMARGQKRPLTNTNKLTIILWLVSKNVLVKEIITTYTNTFFFKGFYFFLFDTSYFCIDEPNNLGYESGQRSWALTNYKTVN